MIYWLRYYFQLSFQNLKKEIERNYIIEKTEIELPIKNEKSLERVKIALQALNLKGIEINEEHLNYDYNQQGDYLEEIQETATKRVNQIIDDLKEKSNLTEDMKNTDMLYWVGTMNAIRQKAEEIILNELIYV